MKAGSDIVLEIHYTPNGMATTDKSKIGLIFYKGHPEKRELTVYTGNSSFEIPAGDPNYEVRGYVTLESDSELVGMMPHMHLRGKDFSYKLVFPNGESTTLLSVPNYDFHWQLYYALEHPVVMPKGTRIETTAHFDNSPRNRQNPDPTKNVRWGQQSWDEMMLGWFDVAIPVKADPGDIYRSVDGGSFLWRLFHQRSNH